MSVAVLETVKCRTLESMDGHEMARKVCRSGIDDEMIGEFWIM